MTLPFYTSTGSFFNGGTKYHMAFYSNSFSKITQGKGTMFGGLKDINHYSINYGFKFGNKYQYQAGGIWMSTLQSKANNFEKTVFERKTPSYRYNNFTTKKD